MNKAQRISFPSSSLPLANTHPWPGPRQTQGSVLQTFLVECRTRLEGRKGKVGLDVKVLGVWGGACVEASQPGRMRWGERIRLREEAPGELAPSRLQDNSTETRELFYFFLTLEALRGSLILGRIENR